MHLLLGPVSLPPIFVSLSGGHPMELVAALRIFTSRTEQSPPFLTFHAVRQIFVP